MMEKYRGAQYAHQIPSPNKHERAEERAFFLATTPTYSKTAPFPTLNRPSFYFMRTAV
jgi:hypothetical protein